MEYALEVARYSLSDEDGPPAEFVWLCDAPVTEADISAMASAGKAFGELPQCKVLLVSSAQIQAYSDDLPN